MSDELVIHQKEVWGTTAGLAMALGVTRGDIEQWAAYGPARERTWKTEANGEVVHYALADVVTACHITPHHPLVISGHILDTAAQLLTRACHTTQKPHTHSKEAWTDASLAQLPDIVRRLTGDST